MRLVGPHLGSVEAKDGTRFQVDVSIEAAPAALYDAVAVFGGKDVTQALAANGLALEFLKDAYRHCKPILAVAADALLEMAADTRLPSGEPDPGIILAEQIDDSVMDRFVEAIARHRVVERYADPPRV